jgi:protein-S-isoprenylcysteine O-methyltransferase Ste14
VLGLAWLAYFAAHSVLASLALKGWVERRWPSLVPAYRLFFNAAAVLLLIPVLGLMYALHGPWLWAWEGPWALAAAGLNVLALGGFLWSLRWYDGSEFLGLRQWRTRQRSVLDQERFHISPLHRYVRHPWYSLGLVLVWARDMDAAQLLSAVLITGYFVIGSRLEERKLVLYHGPVYARYRERVPSLVPLPWRTLSRTEAARLGQQAASDRSGPDRL